MISPNLKESISTPIYEQLYEYIKNEIILGNLEINSKLPSKRTLSDHLGISVNTITSAYEILIDEGYIYSKERIGYFISDIDSLINIDFKKYNSSRVDFKKDKILYNLKYNNIDTDNFPLYNWRKSTLNVLNNNDWLVLRDPQGIDSLRECICDYLKNSRNVITKPENIIISSGIEYLFQILFYILPQDSVFAIENPGFKMFKDIFKNNNFNYNPIDIDEKGISFDKINKSDSNILCITPSHQFPTGVIMPIDRRIQLLNWASLNKNRFIIEDDYDSEFKYYAKPIPALKSLDKSGNIIYISNFSKSISPTLRISYMVLPDTLLKLYKEDIPFINCPVSTLNQLILSDFIENKYFERHLNRMRNIYKNKREIATNFIKQHEDSAKYNIVGSDAGLHFSIEVNNNMTENELINKALNNGILVEGINSYYSENISNIPTILIGFAGLSDYHLIESIRILLDSWK